jgi:hypothetical protein
MQKKPTQWFVGFFLPVMAVQCLRGKKSLAIRPVQGPWLAKTTLGQFARIVPR